MLQVSVKPDVDSKRNEGFVAMEQPLGCGYSPVNTDSSKQEQLQTWVLPTGVEPETLRQQWGGPTQCWVSIQITLPPMSFTTYDAAIPINKYITYNRKEDKIQKESRASDAYRCKFMATHTQAKDELHAVQILEDLDECSCISIATLIGYAPEESVKIVSRKSQERENLDEWNYRSKDTMEFKDGSCTLFPIDYDYGGFTPDQVVRKIREIMPEFRNVSIIVSPSSSSYIYSTDQECEIVGSKGMHLFVPIINAADVPQWAQLLHLRAWKAGYGEIHLAADGKQLIRDALEDNCIYTPDRLLYSKPELGPGLERCSPGVQIYSGAFPMVLVRPPKPSEALKDQVKRLVSKAKRSNDAEAKRVRDAYCEKKVAEQLERLPRRERTAENEKKIRKEVESMVNGGPLAPGHILIRRNGDEVSVADILKDPYAYKGEQFADPVDPYAYGFDKRIATLHVARNGRKITMYSFAHGGRTFILRKDSTDRQRLPLHGGDIYATIESVISGLAESGEFYRRGSSSGPQIVKLLNNDGQFYAPTKDQLSVELNRMFDFYKSNAKGEIFAVDCPDALVKHVPAATELLNHKLKELKAVVDHPVVTLQGKIVDKEGYNAQTKLYFDMCDCYPEIRCLSDDEVGDALRRVLHPFRDIAFDGPSSVSVLLCAMITVLLRAVLDIVPMFLFGASMPGSGKTLLAKAICVLFGITPDLESLPTTEEELQKVILSQLNEGRKVITFDNINVLKSDALCALCTTETYAGRILGSSRMIRLQNTQTTLFTGNNVRVCGDLTRRVLRCNLAPAVEAPEDREFDFDLLKEVRNNRFEMISDLLSLVFTAYQSDVAPPVMGSFENWSNEVGRALKFCAQKQQECRWDGVMQLGDPLACLKENRDADPQRERALSFVNAMQGLVGDNPFTCAELTHLIKDYEAGGASTISESEYLTELEDVFLEVGSKNGRDINSRMLSGWIDKLRGRPFDDVAVVYAGIKGKSRRKQWRIMPMDKITKPDGTLMVDVSE